jgi:glycosyltransferase involved in cell wall biosynthesis
MKENYAWKQTINIANADAVFVTHERLHKEASEINRNCFIIPNAIPHVEQYAETCTEPADRVRLFWQGSVTHEEDINLIRYAIENIANTRKDSIEMIMAGYSPDDKQWARMVDAYTCNRRLKRRIFKAMHFQHYYKAYAHADVCLVPLVNSKFNSMKSNLKVLEAANLALPVIAHNVHPYKDMPVTYANGTNEWVKSMRMYIDSEAARYDDGQRLKEFCDKWFNYASINRVRKDVFDYVKVTV